MQNLLLRHDICVWWWLLHASSKGTWVSLVAQTIKNPPAMQETWVWAPDWEDLLEKGMAIHSSILAWRIPWTEEPGKLQSIGSLRVEHDWETNTFTVMEPMEQSYRTMSSNTVFCFSWDWPCDFSSLCGFSELVLRQDCEQHLGSAEPSEEVRPLAQMGLGRDLELASDSGLPVVSFCQALRIGHPILALWWEVSSPEWGREFTMRQAGTRDPSLQCL